jgi:hypothetical protein
MGKIGKPMNIAEKYVADFAQLDKLAKIGAMKTRAGPPLGRVPYSRVMKELP